MGSSRGPKGGGG